MATNRIDLAKARLESIKKIVDVKNMVSLKRLSKEPKNLNIKTLNYNNYLIL